MKFSLFIFILLSALVHAIIIGMQDKWVFSISEYHEQGSSTLDVDIVSKKINTPATGSAKKPFIHPEAKKENKFSEKPPPRTISKKNLTASQATLPPSENTPPASKIIDLKKSSSLSDTAIADEDSQISTPEHQSNTKKTPSETLENTITNNTSRIKNNNNETLNKLLNAELEKHFYYPRAAQRKNREGNVLLAFTINSDGKIENIHINKSSGYTILDNAAIRALSRAGNSKNFAMALNGRHTELTVPINYRLLNH